MTETEEPQTKETLLLRGYDLAADAAAINQAGRILRGGGIVAIPTETVYGLAGNALDPDATGKIYAAKGRPSDNPLIVHIDRLEEWPPLVRELPEEALLLARKFWPGPLTIILPKSGLVPDATSGGLDTVAVRMPWDPIARAVIRAAGMPLAAPSANRSGSPSPTTWRHCVDDLWGRVDAILQSHDCRVGVESTVLSLCREGGGAVRPRLLRPGAVTLEQLREVLGEVVVDRGVLEHLEDGEKAGRVSGGTSGTTNAPGSTPSASRRTCPWWNSPPSPTANGGTTPPKPGRSSGCCGNWTAWEQKKSMSTPRKRTGWVWRSTTAWCGPPPFISNRHDVIKEKESGKVLE